MGSTGFFTHGPEQVAPSSMLKKFVDYFRQPQVFLLLTTKILISFKNIRRTQWGMQHECLIQRLQRLWRMFSKTESKNFGQVLIPEIVNVNNLIFTPLSDLV